MTGGIFISYRRDDDPSSAARIRDALAQRLGGRDLFMDIDSVKAGQRFEHELNKALERSRVLIAIIGPQWLRELHARAKTGERDYVRIEIAAALKKGIPVIPIRVGRMSRIPSLPTPEQLPEDIRDLFEHQAHDVTHENFARDIASLTKDIQGLVPQPWRMKVGRKTAIALGAVGLLVAYKVVQSNLPVPPVVLFQTGRLFDVAQQHCDTARGFMKSNASDIKSFGCEQETSCPTMQRWLNTCNGGIEMAAADYRNRIEYAFAFDQKCQGIKFLQNNHAIGKDPIKVNTKEVLDVISSWRPHWSLIVDYHPGDQKTSWTLHQYPEVKVIGGDEEMDPKDIVAAVCAIIKNQSG